MNQTARLSVKTFIIILLLILSSVALSACQIGAPKSENTNGVGGTGILESETPADGKTGFTSLTGVVKTQGTVTLLQSGAQTTPIQSYRIKLSEYDGQTVTVTGQFSGDDLFVTELTPVAQ